jgi:undecaprenyl diphosphate synthase
MQVLQNIISPCVIKNIAFIMDGNRRWALENNIQLDITYDIGSKVFCDIIVACIAHSIKEVIFYALSFDNYQKRSQGELSSILKAGTNTLQNNKHFFIINRIKIVCIGDRLLYDQDTIDIIQDIEAETNRYESVIVVYVLLIYDPIKDVKNYYNNALLYSSSIGPIDIIIRTGGYSRLSGFLPIQSMYADLIVLKVLWPDFNSIMLKNIINSYTLKQNYGR